MSQTFKGKPTKSISLLDISGRTVSKIVKRMQMKCCICGWDRCVVDLHHIIPRAKGGPDDISNLTPLCPNCHREVHHNLIDANLLKSIETLYGDEWKKHYFNSENEWVHPSNFLELKKCPECGRYIPKFNKTFCSVECHQNHYKKLSKLPSVDELTKDVNTLKLADVARKYNVSHTQIARWCKKLNITRPVRGNK
jgi:hypothetical protein